MDEPVNVSKCFLKEESFLGNNIQNLTAEMGEMESSAGIGYGSVVGVGIVLLLNSIFTYEIDSSNDTTFTIKIKLNKKTFLKVLILIILMLLLPIFTLILLLTLAYKMVCLLIIKNKDKNFVKFLDSFDVFWCLEEDLAKSVINVVGVIEANSCEKLVNDIKEKLRDVILSHTDDDVEKIFYKRSEMFGFHYWRRQDYVDLDEYVQIVEYGSENGVLCKDDFENIVTKASHKPLPCNNKGLFQILITKNPIAKSNIKDDYSIIFRIHHSVGDGVTLIEFLCETFADDVQAKPACLVSNTNKPKVHSDNNFATNLRKICEIPISFVNLMIKDPDVNSLHGPELECNTVFKWIDTDDNLLSMIKDIKKRLEGARFSDILALALSRGLNYYFTKTEAHIPETVGVVVPIRFPNKPTINENNRLNLKNNFSVAILDLPVKSYDFKDVREKCEEVRNSADPLTNYYFLKIANYILPKQVLEPTFKSVIPTMVFSNLPGPDSMNICGGNLLKSLVFFIPLKGTSGIGVTALCYGGVLRFGASVDRTLVKNPDDLALILEGMVGEIKRLHQEYVK